jgi:hypothetical protein
MHAMTITALANVSAVIGIFQYKIEMPRWGRMRETQVHTLRR